MSITTNRSRDCVKGNMNPSFKDNLILIIDYKEGFMCPTSIYILYYNKIFSVKIIFGVEFSSWMFIKDKKMESHEENSI